MAFIQTEYKSNALLRGTSVKVILPTDGMAGGVEPPFRTVYFLPGYSTTATELITYLSMRNQAELKGLAIVLPDGENLFYQDLPERMTLYSTYVGEELVEVTRKLFPVSDKREDTYIAGISMGGYGALYNGMKYRDTFSKVAAFSPAVDPGLLLRDGAPGFSDEQFQGLFGNREGFYGSSRDMTTVWTDRTIENRPELFLCCGREDRAVWNAVEPFEKALQEAGIPHEYREGHGDHELYYWEQMMDPAFSFLVGIEEGTKDKLVIPG